MKPRTYWYAGHRASIRRDIRSHAIFHVRHRSAINPQSKCHPNWCAGRRGALDTPGKTTHSGTRVIVHPFVTASEVTQFVVVRHRSTLATRAHDTLTGRQVIAQPLLVTYHEGSAATAKMVVSYEAGSIVAGPPPTNIDRTTHHIGSHRRSTLRAGGAASAAMPTHVRDV